VHNMWLSSAKSVNAALTDTLLFIAGILCSMLNHNKRLILMKNTHTAHHSLSYINVCILEYTHMYIQDCHESNFEEVAIPSNTKKLAFVT
jgi:hypothetical protein